MPEPKGPGLIMVFGPVDRMTRIGLRTVTKVIEPQDVITKDNVSVKVDAVLYYRVIDPMKAVLQVENYMYATSQVALTTLRSTVGQAELDELLTERDKVNHRLQAIIDGHTEPWGIKVSVVEDQGCRSPRCDEALHGRPGGGRTRTAREGHQCRG